MPSLKLKIPDPKLQIQNAEFETGRSRIRNFKNRNAEFETRDPGSETSGSLFIDVGSHSDTICPQSVLRVALFAPLSGASRKKRIVGDDAREALVSNCRFEMLILTTQDTGSETSGSKCRV